MKRQEIKAAAVRLGDRARPIGVILGPGGRILGRVGREEGVGFAQIRGSKKHLDVGMILQISSDGSEIFLDLDTSCLENVYRPDTTQLKNLGG